jgi:hypothetical protein
MPKVMVALVFRCWLGRRELGEEKADELCKIDPRKESLEVL